MTAKILDGRLVSDFLLKAIKKSVDKLKRKRIFPKLAIILVGDNPASLSYVKRKNLAATRTGILCDQINLDEKTKEGKVIKIIEKLNKDKSIHGILVQLPLPAHMDASKIINAISFEKDVDGLHSINIGGLFGKSPKLFLTPCTPTGIIKLLDYYKIKIEGKNAVIIGRSVIVGKPLAIMLLNLNATVTLCHSLTQNIEKYTREADILVAALGKPKFVTAKMVKKGAVVIDVGTTKVFNKIMGDVDFNNVSKQALYITPVPGGVGPMTVACLMENTVRAAKFLS